MSIEMHNGSSDHNKAEVFNGKMIIVHIKRRITTLNRSKFAFFSFIFDNTSRCKATNFEITIS